MSLYVGGARRATKVTTNLMSLLAFLQSPDLTGGKILEANVRTEEREVQSCEGARDW